MSQLEEHISKSELLVNKCSLQTPDYIEMCAVGSILQAYYNGIENILLIIAKGIDGNNPSSGKWHSEILSSMFEKTDNRPPVFSETLKPLLFDYMNFRHFFRHSYGFNIKWEKASPLFLGMTKNWNEVKSELEKFMENF